MNRFLVLLAMAFIIALYPLTRQPELNSLSAFRIKQSSLVDGGNLIARYRVSTSKFGNGDSSGSYGTPLGTLFVSGKFGDHLRAGTVIKNRMPTGEIIAVDARIAMPLFRA